MARFRTQIATQTLAPREAQVVRYAFDVPKTFAADRLPLTVTARLRHRARTLKLQAIACKTGPGGWIILVEPELHFGKQIVVPDLAGWRRDRLPEIADVAYLTLEPDWICEVLSKSTETIDRGRKLRIYAAAGVRHAWLVNARRRMLEVMRQEDGKWVLLAVHVGDETIRAEPFDAIELDLRLLWADIAPAPPRPARVSEAALEYEYDDLRRLAIDDVDRFAQRGPGRFHHRLRQRRVRVDREP